MQLAIVKNNEILEINDSSILFPNVSFTSAEIEPSFLEENSAMLVKQHLDIDPTTHRVEDCPPYILDNIVYTVKSVVKTSAEIEEDILIITNLAEEDVRNQRNKLLKDSDWTQVADAPVDKTSWAAYRQVLRDITQQEGFPFNVTFPNPPL